MGADLGREGVEGYTFQEDAMFFLGRSKSMGWDVVDNGGSYMYM